VNRWRLRAARLGAAALVAFAIACQTTGTVQTERGKPQAFFWEAAAPEGGRLFLLGSVHIGDGRELALDPRIETDWQTAEELVVELDLTAPSPIDAVEATNRHGLLPEPRTLQQVVRAETYRQVAEYMKRRDYSMDRVDQMRPWMVALVVQDLEYAVAGLRAENGVDAVLLRRAKGAKPIIALETLDEQMAAFAGLPDALQELWLGDVLRESERLLEFTREMLRVWEAGDDARMLEMVFPPAAADPDQLQFYERMYWSRNRVMTDRLMALAADGKARFVVIGTGHLLGPKGIPELLAQRGYRVRRLGSARVVGGPAAAPAVPAATPALQPQPAPTPIPTQAPAPPIEPAVAPPPTLAPAAEPVAPTTAPAQAAEPPPTAEPLPGAEPLPTLEPSPPVIAPVPAPVSPPGLLPVPDPASPPLMPVPAPPSEHERWLGQDAPGAAQPSPPPPPAPEPAVAPEPVPKKRRAPPGKPGSVSRPR
jgi:hypothetical protein